MKLPETNDDIVPDWIHRREPKQWLPPALLGNHHSTKGLNQWLTDGNFQSPGSDFQSGQVSTFWHNYTDLGFFFFFFNLNNNNKTTAKPQHNNFLYILELHYIFIRFLELQPTISGFFGLLEFSSVSFRSGKVHLQDFNISIDMFHCQIWLS